MEALIENILSLILKYLSVETQIFRSLLTRSFTDILIALIEINLIFTKYVVL